MSLRSRLGRARDAFAGHLGGVRSGAVVDAAAWDALEDALILADVGVATTADLLRRVRERADSLAVDRPEVVLDLLKEELVTRLGAADRGLASGGAPSVWLFVGVNGAGKTTTIGKLGRRQVEAGKKVVFAAGDTFRAAAVHQLELWGERAGASVVRGAEGADPGSVVFDAVEHHAALAVEHVVQLGADLVVVLTGTVDVDGAAGDPVFANGYLHFAAPPANRWLRFALDLPVREETLTWRDQAVRTRFRGDQITAMENFGQDLTFFAPIA